MAGIFLRFYHFSNGFTVFRKVGALKWIELLRHSLQMFDLNAMCAKEFAKFAEATLKHTCKCKPWRSLRLKKI